MILEFEAAKKEIEALKTSLEKEKIQKTQGTLLVLYFLISAVNNRIS